MNSIEGLTQQIQELTDLAAAQVATIDTLTREKLAAETRAAQLADLLVVSEAAKGHAIQQAQQWAMEARTQRGTVLDILRHFGCPENDWEALSLIKAAQAAAPVAAMKRVYQVRLMRKMEDWRTIPDSEKQRYLDDPDYDVKISDVADDAAPLHPLPAEQGAAPQVVVDSIESKYGQFWSLMGAWGNATPGDDADKKANELVKYIDAHIAQTVVAAVENATKDMVPLSADARSVFLDGFGLLDIAYPAAPQQQAQATLSDEQIISLMAKLCTSTGNEGIRILRPLLATNQTAPDMPRDGQHLQKLPLSVYTHPDLGEMWDRFAMHSYAVRHMPDLPIAPVAAAAQGEAPPLPEPHMRRGEGLPGHWSKKQMRDFYQQGRASGIEEAANLVKRYAQAQLDADVMEAVQGCALTILTLNK